MNVKLNSKKVTIKGQEFHLAYTYETLAEFCEEAGLTLQNLKEIMGKMSFKQMGQLVQYGLNKGNEIQEREKRYTYKETCNVITAYPKLLTRSFEVFTSQMESILSGFDEEDEDEGETSKNEKPQPAKN